MCWEKLLPPGAYGTVFWNDSSTSLTRSNKQNNNSGDSGSPSCYAPYRAGYCSHCLGRIPAVIHGFTRDYIFGQVHQHSILPLIHIRNSRWSLRSLLPLCHAAAVLQWPLPHRNADMHSHTRCFCHPAMLWVLASYLWSCPSIHLTIFCWERCTSAAFAVFMLYACKRLKTALVRPKLGRWLMERKFQ